MADAENVLSSSKKRAAGRELSRDNPGLDDEEVSDQEIGTFKRASDEVLAARRMVKVRRQQTTSAPPNPFAAIRLVPPTETAATPAGIIAEEKAVGDKLISDDVDGKNDLSKDCGKRKDEIDKQAESDTDEPPKAESVADAEKAVDNNEKTISEAAEPDAGDEKSVGPDKNENEEQKGNSSESKETSAETTNLSSFQQLSSSRNAFTGLAGSGASSSAFSFGVIPTDGVSQGADSGFPASKNENPPYPSFGFGLSNNGNSSLFGTTGLSIVGKSGDHCPSMKEVPVETGEENEEAVFQADSVLFEFIDGCWKERGKGEIKVNVSKSGTERARLVMRARGNYRLILNASLYPDMTFTNMDKKGITFACLNSASEGKESLSTFALKFKDGSIVEKFRETVMAHKGKLATVSIASENILKASDV